MKTRIVSTALGLLLTLVGSAAAAAQDRGPMLGVHLTDLTPEIKTQLDFDGEGVLVTQVVEGSAADKAGIEKGDIIVAFKGELITSTQQLVGLIRDTKPGEKVKALIQSGGESKSIKIKMGEKTAQAEAPAPPPMQKWFYVEEDEKPWLGVQLMNLNPQLADFFQVEQGILIAAVVEDGPAAKAGLKAGDVIVGLDGEDVATSDDLLSHLASAEAGHEVDLVIVRRGERLTTPVTLAKKPALPSAPEAYQKFLERSPSNRYRSPDRVLPTPLRPELQPDRQQESIEQFRRELEAMRREMQEMRKELRRSLGRDEE